MNFCNMCGAKLASGVKFCASCGNPLGGTASDPTPPAISSGDLGTNGVGQEEVQLFIDKWADQNKVKEFIEAGDVSANVLARLLGLQEDGLVWSQVMTNAEGYLVMPGVEWFGPCRFCEQLGHLNTNCKGSKGMGWGTVGFFIAQNTDPLSGEFDIPDRLPCAGCNADGSFDAIDEDCSVCDGEGDVTAEYDWPGCRP